MSAMPKKSTAFSPTECAATAYRAIQGDVRLSVLRFLLERGTSTRADVAAATTIPSSTVQVAIRELVDAGYLITNVEGDRKGRLVEYTVDRTKLTADLFSLMGWLLA